MPGFDRTGPMGSGPGAGRRLGHCGSSGWFGRFRPRSGFCRGFGFRRRGYGELADEKELLLEEKSWLEQRLNAIKERLSALA